MLCYIRIVPILNFYLYAFAQGSNHKQQIDTITSTRVKTSEENESTKPLDVRAGTQEGNTIPGEELLALPSVENINITRMDVDKLSTKHPKMHTRQGIARDLVSAATEIEKAASDIEDEEIEDAESEVKSDRIEHEEGNIPFEWRVQLIHKRMGDAWDNRRREQDRESSGFSERSHDRGADLVNHGKRGESYRKKKIDILIEEWWNNEKWNRYWWDKHDHSNEKDNYHEGSKYGGSGKGRENVHKSKGRWRKGKNYSKGDTSNPIPYYVIRGNSKRANKSKRRPMQSAQNRQERRFISSLDGRPICARSNNEYCQHDPHYPDMAHSPTCDGEIREAVPLWAPNYEGKWKIIANTKKFKQKYLIQVCTKSTLDCALLHNLRCREKYGRLPLVALDLTNSQQLHVDWFSMPFACDCRPSTNL